jgi:uncharacterized oxidoreductase
MPSIQANELTTLSRKILISAGASFDEADTVAKLLVRANLSGVDSHGVFTYLHNYVQGIRTGQIKPGARIEILNETPSTALFNGNLGFGQVTAVKAMQLAIEKARNTGVSAVAIFNCNHIGRLADYSRMAVKNGMIAFVAANSDPCVAPYGGKKAVLSTAPLSWGIPTHSERPIIVDLATSAVAEGRIRAALYKGEQIPSDWIVNSQGQPSTNPAELYEPPLPPEQVKLAGALQPAGGYKGYALALIAEVLAGALSGTGCSEDVKSLLTNGVFILVLDPTRFAPLMEFEQRVDRLIQAVKNSPIAPGFKGIRVPGEREVEEEEKRLKSGIHVPDTAWKALLKLCGEYGVHTQSEASEEH